MTAGFHAEVLYTAGYAAALVGIAFALEWLAQSTHRRSERLRVAGFTYHHELDLWQCPTGQHLQRSASDERRRVVVYRASGHACNACHCKPNCTDSQDGREIEHRLDSWVQSELRRFHRGLSLVLLLLAAVLLGLEMRAADTRRDWMMLWALLLPIVLLGGRLMITFLAREPSASAPDAAQAEPGAMNWRRG